MSKEEPMLFRISFGVLAAAALIAGCDRSPTGPREVGLGPRASTLPTHVPERAAMDRLARRFARAMADPTFRGRLKSELDQSRFVEHKIQLQHFLADGGGRAMRDVARLSASSEKELAEDVITATAMEMYFPVPAHRASWNGGSDLLVASAWEDHEAPVAYDVQGKRQVLSADQPPAVPVLALEPVETDFSVPIGAPTTCISCQPPPPTPPPPPTGLFMTYSHFVQDFEGWLKGAPEFEIHILGQSGASDSLKDYQCAGANAGSPYNFDQNDLDWRGSVLLFSQSQLNSYRTTHPNQNFRIIALEDDDTGCVIKFDAGRFRNLLATLQAQYPSLTGAKDTTSGLVRFVKRANALQKILSAAYSFITTQDDIIGNAIEDVVAGEFRSGANWIVKGESNQTNGWLKLEMH
jgi:hypothetical protein